MKHKIYLFLYLTLSYSALEAKLSVTANQNIATSAFDKRTGIWYLGSGIANGDQAIFSVGPVTEQNTLSITNLSPAPLIENNSAVYYLSLNYRAAATPFLAFSKNQNSSILVIKNLASGRNGSNQVIQDNTNNGDNGAIRAITTTQALRKNGDNTDYNFIIAAISGPGQPFLNDRSGLSLTRLTGDTTLQTFNTSTFTASSTWVKGDGLAITPAAKGASLKWNNTLQRLYVGISGASHANNGDPHTIITVSCFKLNADFNALTNVPMNAELSGYGSGADAGHSSIIGATNVDPVSFSTHHIDIMETTTGKFYLIVNGGLGNPAEACIKVFAIPLVGPEGDVPGTLAAVHNRTTPLIDFTKQASGENQLFHETDTAAIVGNMVLPCPGATGIAPFVFAGIDSSIFVKKMEAVGDTVYCSISGIDNNDNQPGIYYSQALFNGSGAITKWTDWALATPSQVSGISNTNAACFTFAIDTARGKILTVPQNALTSINITQWTHQTDLTTFGGQINNLLQGPCYSHLVLDQYVENIGNKVQGRFALFGGDGKVVAIRTGYNITGALYTGSNKPTAEWDNPVAAAVDISEGLPQGPILCLGYTNLSEDDEDRKNFFFAGTNDGLYVYTINDEHLSGFAINAAFILDDINLDDSIFNKGKWTKFDSIKGPINHIATSTPGLISVIAKDVDGHRITEIAVGGSLTGNDAVGNDFLVDPYLYEQDVLNNYEITDIQTIFPIKKGDNSTLLTGTNQGIIGSRSPLTFAHKTIVHHFSAPQRTRGNSMFWFVERTDDISTGSITQKSRIYQAAVDYINADGLTTKKGNSITLVPSHPITTDIHTFTLSNDNDVNRHNNLHTLDMITTPLYSNGSLRFFGMRTYAIDDTTYSKLVTLPYRTHYLEANMINIVDIPDQDLKKVSSIYWINNVGAGHTMIGTDIGVLSLE